MASELGLAPAGSEGSGFVPDSEGIQAAIPRYQVSGIFRNLLSHSHGYLVVLTFRTGSQGTDMHVQQGRNALCL